MAVVNAITPGLDTGVFGGVIASNALSVPRGYRGVARKRRPDINENNGSKVSPSLMIVSIIITIIIFIVAVAYFDLIREKLVYEHTARVAQNKLVAPTDEDRQRILLVADEAYSATKDFTVVVTVLAFVLLPILFYVYQSL